MPEIPDQMPGRMPELLADSLSLSARASRSELIQSAMAGAAARSARRPQRAVASELSYEKALKIHGRRNAPPPPRDGSLTSASHRPAQPNQGLTEGSRREPGPSAKTDLAAGLVAAAKSTTEAQTRRTPPNAAKTALPTTLPAQPTEKNRNNTASRRRTQVAATRDELIEESSGQSAHARSPSADPSAPKAKPGIRRAPSSANRSAKRRPTIESVPKPVLEPVQESRLESRLDSRPDSGLERRFEPSLDPSFDPRLENRKRQPAKVAEEFRLSLVNQRKSIVSIRLTEPEFARLRDRADESGISVSAYMRSCVLEAETLRTQVKQALAEMRSLTAVAGRPGYPALNASGTASGVLSGNRATERGGDRFRVFLRSMALLFSPLLSFRRSA